MSELVREQQEIWEVREQARGGGLKVHGVFDDQREAAQRYAEVVRQDPMLASTPGTIGVFSRYCEVFRPLAAPVVPAGQGARG